MLAEVKTIAVTKPTFVMTEETGARTAEDIIGYCARVSNPDNQTNFNSQEKLLSYLMKNAHWSPFEMVHVVMEVKTTRDISRQLLRHPTFRFQEFSQRYAAVNSSDFVTRECRLQDKKNRQNSLETDDANLIKWWDEKQNEVILKVSDIYDEAIRRGIAKEQARVILPEGNTPSRLYAAASLRSWYHYCVVRTDDGTQKEHRYVAGLCWQELVKDFPFLEKIGEMPKEINNVSFWQKAKQAIKLSFKGR